MSLLHNGLTFLNFDDTYLLQNKLHSYSHEDIDFTHLDTRKSILRKHFFNAYKKSIKS